MEEQPNSLIFTFENAPPRCSQELQSTFEAYLHDKIDRAILHAACTATLGTITDRDSLFLFRLSEQWRSRDHFDQVDWRILDCAIAVGPGQTCMCIHYFNKKHAAAIRDYLLTTCSEAELLPILLRLYRWRELIIGDGSTLWGQTLLTVLPNQGAQMLALIGEQDWSVAHLLALLHLLDDTNTLFHNLRAALAGYLWPKRKQIPEYYLPFLIRVAPQQFAEWVANQFLTPLRVDYPSSHWQAKLLAALMDSDPARYIDYAVQATRLDFPCHTAIPSLVAEGIKQAFRFDPVHYLPLITTLLTLNRANERAYGLQLLRQHDWEGKLPYFITLLGHGHTYVRESAIEWLTKQGETCLPALAEALTHKTVRVRLHAAITLGRIDTPDALAALRRHFPKERASSVREKISPLLRLPA